MRHPMITGFVAASALLVLAARPCLSISGLPSQFVADDATPGVPWDTPVAMAFLPGGRMLVVEKAGIVWSVVNGVRYATPMIDRSAEVLAAHDRGMLGIAVDPNYVTNHYVYLLYTVDPDSNGTDTNDDAFGRLTRYTVSFADSNVFQASSRTVLIGHNWRAGIPSGSQSHTIGALAFGTDGSLFISAGEGAQYDYEDAGGNDPGLFGATKTDPYEDIGAYRAQYLGSLAGKILRVNPVNGQGYSNNPFYDGNLSSNRSRVWASGLRNPFRFCVRPGSGATTPGAGDPGTLYIGDVGLVTWEEMNVAPTGGLNFGWPCKEGRLDQADYAEVQPPHDGCSSMGTPSNPSLPTQPRKVWNHNLASLSDPPGDRGSANMGGVFYTGNRYPLAYRNAYFFGDYGNDWVKVATVDGADQVTGISSFCSAANGPVCFATDPASGDVFYVAVLAGQIFHIRYTGTSQTGPPIVVASATPTFGGVPLPVQFSSFGTSDPDNDPLAYSWNFGDQTGSTLANPQHTYSIPGEYSTVLTVNDGTGNVVRDTVLVVAMASSAFPSTPILDTFNRANGPLGSPWAGDLNGLSVNANALVQTCCYGMPLWNPTAFGPNQEAYVTFTQVTANAPEHDLRLKVQTPGTSSAHIEVRYDASLGRLSVGSYAPGLGWLSHVPGFAATFAAGDRLGARAFANGAIQVFKNSTVIATGSLDGWPYATAGGFIGLTLDGATSSRMDDFGGGTIPLDSNTPPQAAVLSPLDSTFYLAGQSIVLTGSATDAQTPSGSLVTRWEVDLHHNTHVHPNSWVGTGTSFSFPGENHDDGTGVWQLVRFLVTDAGGLKDTAFVHLFPETDLDPSVVTTEPSTPGTTTSARWTFTLENHGGMPAPLSRWRLVADGMTLAEGDTIVPALGAVTIVRDLPPTLSTGPHVVRVVADTLRAIVETIETNNAATRTLSVVPGSGPDEISPLFTSEPQPTPAGVEARVRWMTNEPTTGTVHWGQTPALGDSVLVPAPADTEHVAVLEGLELGTRYHFRVIARDTSGNATLSVVDSFTTQSGPLDTPPATGRTALSGGWPNPASGRVSFALEIPASARVGFAVYDLAGRQIWSDPPGERSAGRWILEWSGEHQDGSRAAAAVYLARVTVNGRAWLRRFVLLR